jgi:multicomponent Na+:H+ antiporter subunit D
LGLGALEVGEHWVIAVLIGSTLLNAAYFLPIIYTAWFRDPPEVWPHEHAHGTVETAWTLLLPPLVTALLALLVGVLAGTDISPLAWAKRIASREYGL